MSLKDVLIAAALTEENRSARLRIKSDDLRIESDACASLAGTLRAEADGLPVDPPPVTPIPTPTDPPSALYAEIGGIPADAKPVPVGVDVSGLTGNNLLTAGDYVASGDLHDGVGLFAQDPGRVMVKLGQKQGTSSGKNATLAGLTIVAGKNALDDDNTHAAFNLEAGTRTHAIGYTGSAGVMCCVVGNGVTQYRPHYYDCGTIGRGWAKVTGYREYGGLIERTGLAGLTNSANKGTRADDGDPTTTEIYIEGTIYQDNSGGDQWEDNYDGDAKFVGCKFRRTKTDKSGQWFKATQFRRELGLRTGSLLLKDCEFGDTPGSAIAINESANVVIDGCRFGKCRNSIELRNMLRGDDKTGDGKDWRTYRCRTENVTVRNCVFGPDAGPIVESSSSVKWARIGMKEMNIVIESNNSGHVVNKLPA